MSPRALALVLAALAAGLAGGWVWPARARVEAVRRETELVQQQGQRAGRRPVGRTTGTPATTGEGARRLRRQVLTLVEGRPLANIQLEVREGPAPGRSSLQFVADGPFGVLAGLAGDLAATPGLALTRVELTPRGESSHLELEAQAW